MIDERTEEQAALFVLGLLPAGEAAAFSRSLAQNRELQTLVASLNNATLALAESAPKVVPPAELKARLLASLATQPGKIVPFKQPWRSLLPWVAALLMLGIFLWQRQVQRAGEIASQAEISRLQSALQQDELERQKLTAARQSLEQQAAELTAAASVSKVQLGVIQEKLQMIEQDRAALQEKLTTMEQSHQLDKARIAVLGSLLKDKPKAVAVSLWNQTTQDGLLVVENLPVLQAGKDYQLWILDPGNPAPVSAGVFKVDAQGHGRLVFKPDQAINEAGKFAITEERAGGVASPTMNKMVVIGG